jgi:hypothetical protein
MEMMLLSHDDGAQTPLYGCKSIDVPPERCMEHGDSINLLTLRMNHHASTPVDSSLMLMPCLQRRKGLLKSSLKVEGRIQGHLTSVFRGELPQWK